MLNPKVSSFLEELRENNNRDWFQENKELYLEAKDYADKYFAQWHGRMQEFDEVDALKVFRIYRDVRFSKNKTPYKNHFSSSISRSQPYNRGGYYLEIGPEKSFIACGFWGPNKEDLFRIRKEIEIDSEEWNEIMDNKRITKTWGSLQGSGVKVAPKGFDKTHPDIVWIRKSQFVYHLEFDTENLEKENFLEEIVSAFRVTAPFFKFMSSVLTTNLNGESLLN
jgi:uncharacterized protein (TIGR02453 family)